MPKIKMDDDALVNHSMNQLAAVLAWDTELLDLPAEGDPLLAACQIIGKAMDFPFQGSKGAEETLEEICAASKIRYRQVILEPEWWKRSHGHLLAFDSKTHQPVALIFDRSGGYVMIDPESRQKVIVNEQVGKNILPTAYAFYRPFPDGEVTLVKLLKFCLKGQRREYWNLGGAGSLAVLISFMFPFATRVIFDKVIPDYNMSLYVQVLIGLIVASISSTIFSFTRSLVVLRLNGIFNHRVQMALWDRLLRLPVQFFSSIPSGDMIQRTLVFDAIRRHLSGATLRTIFNAVFSLFYLFVMLYYSWRLTLVGLGVVFVGMILSGTISMLKIRYEKGLLISNAKINAFLTQVINGISKLRVAAAEKRVFAHWAQMFKVNQQLNLNNRYLGNVATTLGTTLAVLSSLLIIGTAIFMIEKEVVSLAQGAQPAFTVGIFLAFNAAFTPFSSALFSIVNTMVSLVVLVPFWERVKPIVTTPVENSEEQQIIKTLHGDVRVDRVSFRYGEKSPQVLHSVSIEAKKGQFIGIVGPSGCGKSTLCRLLVGFETPEKGEIFYDGKELASLNTHQLRNQMGIILQNSAIFSGSLYQNIVCGGNYSADEIAETIRLSTFNEDLEELPMGLDTILPSGGGILSGGQKQRLLLTRALIRRPNVMILDEGTSALDSVTQERIIHNLETLKATRIVVAHRLNTLLHADRIYVIEKGEVTASGTYHELAQQPGLFQRLLASQSR